MPARPRAKADRTTLYVLGGLAAAVVVFIVIRSRGGSLSDLLAGSPSVRAAQQDTGPPGGASETPAQQSQPTVDLVTGGNVSQQPPPASDVQTAVQEASPSDTQVMQSPQQVQASYTGPQPSYAQFVAAINANYTAPPGGLTPKIEAVTTNWSPVTTTAPIAHPVGPVPGGPVVD